MNYEINEGIVIKIKATMKNITSTATQFDICSRASEMRQGCVGLIKFYFNQINNSICDIRVISKYGISELIEVTYYLNNPNRVESKTSLGSSTGIGIGNKSNRIIKLSNLMGTILPKWEIMIAQILILKNQEHSAMDTNRLLLIRDPILFILNPYYGLYLGLNNIFYSYNINKLCNYISNWGINLNIYIRVVINPINSKILTQLISNIKSTMISNNNISTLFNPYAERLIKTNQQNPVLNNNYHLIGIRTQFDGRFTSRDKSSQSRKGVYIYGNSVNIRTQSNIPKSIISPGLISRNESSTNISSNYAIITKLGTIGYNINHNYHINNNYYY